MSWGYHSETLSPMSFCHWAVGFSICPNWIFAPLPPWDHDSFHHSDRHHICHPHRCHTHLWRNTNNCVKWWRETVSDSGTWFRGFDFWKQLFSTKFLKGMVYKSKTTKKFITAIKTPIFSPKNDIWTNIKAMNRKRGTHYGITQYYKVH